MTIFNTQSGLLVSDCCHLQNFKILGSLKMGNKYMYFKGQNYRKGYTEILLLPFTLCQSGSQQETGGTFKWGQFIEGLFTEGLITKVWEAIKEFQGLEELQG